MDQQSLIQGIHVASLDALDCFAHELIKEHLPNDYLQTLCDSDRTHALCACLIVYVLTATTIVPRQFQLEAVLATLNGQDTIITAGTGSGKTLCIIIPILLCPGTISMTISPLKSLQATQVLESTKYGIPTITINKDTPTDPSLWESIHTGKFAHLIVSPEQLSMFNGHLLCLARLLRQNCTFTQHIKHVHVDEAHNIYTAGLPHHGEEAFRPAYGKLGELHVLLCKEITFQALSATLPHHILSTVQCELMFLSDHISLALSTNHPNITYATTPIIGGLCNFHNFDCLIPDNYAPPMMIPKMLIFYDNKKEAAAAAYNDSRLPKPL
ncbi:P-loop containing nucleoside triphosphate hydrolase protein [Suillus bovinus]|uniref:P-loop containing nucleoside triphosphate hydrolase protein n=1 Tax=Suillus bovinus TaxID=48563 RepID=UPI001B879F9E|nr:P-loop containing nucleoside triphosphate hydrolase protein [Suillus bovinus]KAG2144383.1 P-loop containing nucleoside triphosphate hydrolase protein [Suillus bovinus]